MRITLEDSSMRTLSILISGLLMATFCGVAVAERLTESEASAWLDGYEGAWEERDADRAAELFTPDAIYRDNPYNDPYRGREGIHKYWSDVTADQRNVDFNYELLTTYGRTAVAHWSATFSSASSGSTINLDGVFLLEFDAGGLCSRLREWWHIKVDKASQE
jgi:ketosteroid isomerase-like protein